MERKKDRVDESSALTALVMLVVEKIIREDEILVITAPCLLLQLQSPLFWVPRVSQMDLYAWPKAHA